MDVINTILIQWKKNLFNNSKYIKQNQKNNRANEFFFIIIRFTVVIFIKINIVYNKYNYNNYYIYCICI